MRLGVAPHPLWPRQSADFGDVVETAKAAERLGFHHVFAAGHVLAGDVGLTMDPLVLLAAVAGATKRVELLTSVVVLPLYQSVVLANQTATLDVVAGGRLVLGVGAGWDAEEYAAVGVPFDQRGAITDEHLQVLRSLWSERPASFQGRYTTVRKTSIGVPPISDGGPRVWVGGHSDAALRRALRFAEAWHGSGIDAAAAAETRRRLDALSLDGDRDPGTLKLTSGQFLVPPGLAATQPLPFRPLGGAAPSAAALIDELSALELAGVTVCSLWMPIPAQQLLDGLEWVASEILPHVGDQS